MGLVSAYLIQEHKAISTALRTAKRMADQLHDGQPVPLEDRQDIVDFLCQFYAKCHLGKEERLYFPRLQSAGVAIASGPLGLLQIEHGRVGRLLDVLADTLTGDAAGTDFSEVLHDCANQLEEHLRKENEAIFPIGDTLLTARQQQYLVAAFDAFNDEMLGPEARERLNARLDALCRRYGSCGPADVAASAADRKQEQPAIL